MDKLDSSTIAGFILQQDADVQREVIELLRWAAHANVKKTREGLAALRELKVLDKVDEAFSELLPQFNDEAAPVSEPPKDTPSSGDTLTISPTADKIMALQGHMDGKSGSSVPFLAKDPTKDRGKGAYTRSPEFNEYLRTHTIREVIQYTLETTGIRLKENSVSNWKRVERRKKGDSGGTR